jgi:hypothetical protein
MLITKLLFFDFQNRGLSRTQNCSSGECRDVRSIASTLLPHQPHPLRTVPELGDRSLQI